VGWVLSPLKMLTRGKHTSLFGMYMKKERFLFKWGCSIFCRTLYSRFEI
jgi:hypothetical protein